MRLAERLVEFIRRARTHFSSREQFDQELEEEMLLHRDLRAQELRQNGAASEEDAYFASHRRFGNGLRLREQIHEAWGFTWVDDLRQDVSYGLRRLLKAPGFTLVVVLTLALGIGANTAIFSVVDAVLLRPLPYPHAEQLVSILESNSQQGVKGRGFSYQDFWELQRSGVFSGIAGAQRHDLTLTGVGDPAIVSTVSLTPGIFALLDAAPLAGHTFVPQDNEKGAAPVVLLSEALWRTRFGADTRILGRAIHLDQQAFTVIGIMPASFHVPQFGSHQEIWIPVVQDPLFGPWMEKRALHWVPVVARLRPDVSLAGAQGQVDAIVRRLAAEFPDEDGNWTARVAPLQRVLVGNLRTPLLILLGAVSLVLLLACINIANLLLARATFRTREVAVRQALGAKPSRIVRQLLAENALLGLLGTIFGIALAVLSTHALLFLLPADGPITQPVQLNGTVFVFTLLLSLATSIGFGLAPALLAARSDVNSHLKNGAPSAGSARNGLRLRRFLTRAEVALAMLLVVAAGLLARSLIKMTSVNPGFEAAHVLKAQISLPRYQYSKPHQWSAFSHQLLERIQSQPGLEQSAVAVPLPLADQFINLTFQIADRAAPPFGSPQSADYVSVTPRYFRLMGIPLVRGRFFREEDSRTSSPVAIISESLAQLYFHDQDPLGKRLVFAFPPKSAVPHEIVGIVGNVRDAALTREPGPMMYVPFAQEPFWGGNLVVKTSLPTADVVNAIRQMVAGVDKNLPITDVAAMPAVLGSSVAQPRFRTWLLSGFGLLAWLLAGAGVFGVVSYSVAGRTKEFGVRAALGASPHSIGRMILGEGLRLAATGLGVGLIAALGLAHFLKSEIYGVGAYDPLTFLAAAVVLLLLAALASYFPARRAMRVDPMVALRYE